MCNCSKPITKTECQRLRKFLLDPEKRFFIYHIFDDPERGLEIAHVPKEKTPLQVAFERGFVDKDNNPEFYHISEHPCLHGKEN